MEADIGIAHIIADDEKNIRAIRRRESDGKEEGEETHTGGVTPPKGKEPFRTSLHSRQQACREA